MSRAPENRNRVVAIRRLVLLLALLVAGCAQPAARSETLINPLNTLQGADPWLTYYDGNYYMTTTQWSSIRMWKSPTLAGLTTAKPTTIWADTTPSRCCNVWAPEFHLLDGPNGKRWYVYYSAGTDATLDNQRSYVLESSGSDPLGPYTFKGQIFDPADNGWMIDGSVLTMPDGKLYFLGSSWVGPDQSLFIAPMSDPWTISGGRVLISKPSYPWETSLGRVNEGPVALQHDGKTFIVYSASACWGPDYKLGMLAYNGGDPLKAESWVKQAEPVFQRSDANSVYGPGHNGFFTSPDGKESWIVYHANAAGADGCTGERTTRVQKFTWNDDGTPNFGTPLALNTPMLPPSGEQAGTATEQAAVLAYALVAQNGECLANAANGPALAACDESASQQWYAEYMANGGYRLRAAQGGEVLAASDSGVGMAAWDFGAAQVWQFAQASDGWLSLLASQGGKALGVACTSGAGLQLVDAQASNTCQQFRLQPLGPLVILNANSNRPVGLGANGLALQGSAGDTANQWRFVHQENGFYQIAAEPAGTCLAADPASAAITSQPCAADPAQHWRIDQLNDGMVRFVARANGKVFDVRDCRVADGTPLQQWVWNDSMCQRFQITAP